MTTPTTPEVDDFAAAFAELNLPGDKPADPPKAEDPPADPPAAEDPPADPPKAEDPPADPPAAEDPPADPPKAEDPPAAETEEQIRARIRAEVEAELKKAAPADPPKAAAPEPAPAPVKIYTDEEEQQLSKYKNDWPDIAAAEQLARRADNYRVVEHIFSQLRPILNALQERVEVHGQRSMYDDIVDLVPDYDDVRDKTLAWIETQPDYLRDAYQKVANEGTADQVADLINRYKKETGYSAPAAQPTAKPAAPVAKAAPAPAVAKAAAALKPVATARAEPKTEDDKNDFDSAFAEFSKL